MTNSEPLRIAILGGGLAGAALFRGLSKHAHLAVDIFESAAAFREQGQGIGFNHNAIWALELLGLRTCLDAAGAIRIGSARLVIGQGPETGKKIADLAQQSRGTWITHRASFLEQMFKGSPEDRMHTGKKVIKIEQEEKGVKLGFADGSDWECDVLFGADGIHSKTRRYVACGDVEIAEPKFAGWWNVWTLVPFERGVEHLGKELITAEDARQYGWIGPRGFVMHDQLSDNTLVQAVIAHHVGEDAKDNKEWTKTTTKEELREILRGWDQRLEKGMVDLVSEADGSLKMTSMWHHNPAKSLIKGAVAVVGDAAGATTPWQGSGGGMAMEDAFLLSELFANVNTTEQAKAALKGYDYVNRPRRNRLIASSYDTGLMLSGCHPDTGMDSVELTKSLEHKWDWIVDVDLLKNKEEAVQYMQKADGS